MFQYTAASSYASFVQVSSGLSPTCTLPASVTTDSSRNIYIACQSSNNVVQYDADTFTPTDLGLTCTKPVFVYADRTANIVYIACQNSQTVIGWNGEEEARPKHMTAHVATRLLTLLTPVMQK